MARRHLPPRARRSCSAAGPRPHPRAADSADGVGSASARLASASASASTASPRSIRSTIGTRRRGCRAGHHPRRPSRVQHLSWSPRAYLYRGFLRRAECEYIVQNSTPRLKKSTVVDNGRARASTARFARARAFFSRQQDEDRGHRASHRGVEPRPRGQRRVSGPAVPRRQEYRPHMDAHSATRSTRRRIRAGRGSRRS